MGVGVDVCVCMLAHVLKTAMGSIMTFQSLIYHVYDGGLRIISPSGWPSQFV